jgi:hypothetical protein
VSIAEARQRTDLARCHRQRLAGNVESPPLMTTLYCILGACGNIDASLICASTAEAGSPSGAQPHRLRLRRFAQTSASPGALS